MIRPNLVQRLCKPLVYPKGSIFEGCTSNPFSFGGGLRDGGFSKEAMKLLGSVFSFDYMGAAEFEWGAVPKAFERLYNLRKEERIITRTFDIDGHIIYCACEEGIEGYLLDWLTGQVRSPYKQKGCRLKESTYIYEAFKGAPGFASNIIGGVCVDDSDWTDYSTTPYTRHPASSFIYFFDEALYKDFCKLFSLDTESIKVISKKQRKKAAKGHFKLQTKDTGCP